VAQPHRPIVGKLATQVACDLRRTPTLGKQLGDDIAEFGISIHAARMATCSAHHGPTMGFKRPIGAVATAVAPQLPRHCRRCSVDLVGDLADAESGPPQIGDLKPFVLGQVTRTDLSYGQSIQGRHEPDYLATPVGLVSARPVIC